LVTRASFAPPKQQRKAQPFQRESTTNSPVKTRTRRAQHKHGQLPQLGNPEDDGVVQHASVYACNGSATAEYSNDDLCDNNNNKQKVTGFRNLDTAHENHDQSRNDSDRDNRNAIPDGIWICNGVPCAVNSEVVDHLSTGQFIGVLY
jgi:hypothetical protein